MKNKLLIIFCILTFIGLQAKSERSVPILHSGSVSFPLKLSSPDRQLQITFNRSADGGLTYTFAAHSKTLIAISKIGLSGMGNPMPLSVALKSVKSVWKPVWGKRAVVPEVYNELTLDVKVYQIIVRAYIDRVAFRYQFPKEKAITDLTQFNFNGDYTAWYYNGESANIGPEKLSDCDGKRLPVMTIKADDHNYMAVHEADLSWGEPLILQSRKGETLFSVASKPSTA